LANTDQPSGRGLGWLLGTVVSAAVAGLLVVSSRGTTHSLLVPIVFIVVVILCARYFGLMAGLLGSVAGSVLFAFFLFEPYGRLQVRDSHALSNIVLLLFAGIALSYANSGDEEELTPRDPIAKPRP
jgi:K+-sensing histidine kinase KdpD